MKKTTTLVIPLLLLLICLSSCIDSDYKWDNLDKNGTLNIPPVPLGGLDTIKISKLPNIPNLPEGGIPIEGHEIVLRHTFRDLLGHKSNKHFFFDGAKDASIEMIADVDTKLIGLKIEIYPSILDNAGRLLDQIKIPKQTIVNGDNQKMEILFKSEYMKYMEYANDLRYTFVISADKIDFGVEDIIVFREAILKPGGLHVEIK